MGGGKFQGQVKGVISTPTLLQKQRFEMAYYCKDCKQFDEEHDLRSHRCASNAAPNRVTCNHCAAKDAEIVRLRNQIESMTPKAPKRDRAEYMRNYRKGA